MNVIDKPQTSRRRPRQTPKGRQVDPRALAEIKELLGARSRRRDLLINSST
jgi:formate dehydrogenase